MDDWTLKLSLEGPYGERYTVAMPVDAFTAIDRLVDIKPPDPFCMDIGAVTMNTVVERIRKREIRHDILAAECGRLGRKLAQTMQDAEGWHDASRIGPSERILRGDPPPPVER